MTDAELDRVIEYQERHAKNLIDSGKWLTIARELKAARERLRRIGEILTTMVIDLMQQDVALDGKEYHDLVLYAELRRLIHGEQP